MDKEQRIKELERNIFRLECSDDMLFSNANGNFPLWEAMKKELRELQGDKLMTVESVVKQVFPESWINKREDGTIVVGPPKQVNNG